MRKKKLTIFKLIEYFHVSRDAAEVLQFQFMRVSNDTLYLLLVPSLYFLQCVLAIL